MMLIVASARPQWIGEPIELPNTGRDLMLGLDLSGSMQIEDMQVGNRLVPRITAVKAIAADFTERRQGDRVGLILFGTRAYLQAPLTFDLSTVTRFIDEAQLGFAGEDTAIGDALGLAIKRLRERPASSRIFILLTDGQDTASTVDPMEAAALAAQLDVKIYTIGISRNLGRTTNGRSEVDEAMLNAVAEATGWPLLPGDLAGRAGGGLRTAGRTRAGRAGSQHFPPKTRLELDTAAGRPDVGEPAGVTAQPLAQSPGRVAALWESAMIDGFHLLRPDLLWALLACPLVALALWYRRVHQGDWTKVIDAELLPYLLPDQRGKSQRSRVWIPTLLLTLVTLGAAGPSLQRVELPVIKRADALVIVLDLSASMLAADVQPSRVQRARQKILDLLDTREEGVTGLVVFAGDAHVVTPLTDDTRTIANLMPALSPAIMPLPGADATSALELAAELLLTAGRPRWAYSIDDRWPP
jgi:Mg-chelatase subunit ChlD